MKIVENMPAAEYHAVPAVSASKLKWYGISAEKGKAAEDGLITISKETRDFGEAFHAATLEPITFLSRYVAKPETYPAPDSHAKVKKGEIQAGHPLPWNANAEICEDWEAAQNRKVMSARDFRAFQGMGLSLVNDDRMRPYMLAKGRCELSLFAEIDGIPIKARFDKLIDDGAVVDLKSAMSAEPFKFTRQCIFLKYHVQAWWYSMVMQLCGLPYQGFVFGAVEKTAPYAALCCELDSAAFNKGREEGERLFELYKKCHKEKRWPGYIDQKVPYQMSYPQWALDSQQTSEQIIYQLES